MTDKLDPSDIDVVTIIDGAELDGLDRPAQVLLQGLLHAKVTQYMHHCDSYALAYFPEGDPRRGEYVRGSTYWNSWFGMGRDGQPKGYVQVVDDA